MNIWNIMIWVIKSWVDWKYFIINWNVKRNSISATCFAWWIWLTSSRTQAEKLLGSTILWQPQCGARLFKSEKGTFGVDLYITGSPRENTFKVMVNMNEVTTRLLNFPWLRNFFKAGYIDVSDGYWRRVVLVKTLRCWWRFWPFSSPTS